MSVLKQVVSANSKYASGGRKHETTGNHGQHSANVSFLKMDPCKMAGVDLIAHLLKPASPSVSLLMNAYEWPTKFGG